MCSVFRRRSLRRCRPPASKLLIGTIAFAGQNANGSFSVQYNVQNGGGFSAWPQWAFSLAKDALLANKRVWVGSNGEPFGSNLVFVLILQ